MPGLKPFLKYAGGKRKLAQRISDLFGPDEISFYIEPFLGGGAVLLHMLEHDRAVLYTVSDVNPEIIHLWRTVRRDLDTVLRVAAAWDNDEDTYYSVRALESPHPAVQAARTLWLNKHCYNGLYRLNRAGEFNVPYGKRVNPKIDVKNLDAVSTALKNSAARLLSPRDFGQTFDSLSGGPGCVYCDPPYDPVSNTADFTAYTGTPFTWEDQCRLVGEAMRYVQEGPERQVIISNSSSERIVLLYEDAADETGGDVHFVEMPRAINSKADDRGPVQEVLLHLKSPGGRSRIADEDEDEDSEL